MPAARAVCRCALRWAGLDVLFVLSFFHRKVRGRAEGECASVTFSQENLKKIVIRLRGKRITRGRTVTISRRRRPEKERSDNTRALV